MSDEKNEGVPLECDSEKEAEAIEFPGASSKSKLRKRKIEFLANGQIGAGLQEKYVEIRFLAPEPRVDAKGRQRQIELTLLVHGTMRERAGFLMTCAQAFHVEGQKAIQRAQQQATIIAPDGTPLT